MIFRHAGVAIIYLFLKFFELVNRQWPEVYDLCPTFLHVARVRKQTDMRELHAQRVQFLHVRVFSVSRAILARTCVF